MSIFELIYPAPGSKHKDDVNTAVVIARDGNHARTLLGKGRLVKKCNIIGTAKDGVTARIVSIESI